MPNGRILRELSLSERTTERLWIKRKLAERACDFISEGDAIILDSGTTTAEIAQRLDRFESLMVMTNGLNIANILAGSANVDLMVTGGTLRKKTQSFYGRPAEDNLLRYHFDKVFLGIDGFGLNVGFTTHFEHEAVLNRGMCSVSQQVIVVADSTKFQRPCLHKIRGADEIDILVTDSDIPDNYVRELEGLGVELAVVNINRNAREATFAS